MLQSVEPNECSSGSAAGSAAASAVVLVPVLAPVVAMVNLQSLLSTVRDKLLLASSCHTVQGGGHHCNLRFAVMRQAHGPPPRRALAAQS